MLNKCQLFAVIHRIPILATTTVRRGRTLHPTTATGRLRAPATIPLRVRAARATITGAATDIEVGTPHFIRKWAFSCESQGRESQGEEIQIDELTFAFMDCLLAAQNCRLSRNNDVKSLILEWVNQFYVKQPEELKF